MPSKSPQARAHMARQALRASATPVLLTGGPGNPSRHDLRKHIRAEVENGADPLPESPFQRMLRESINRAVAVGLGKMEKIK